MAIITHFEEGSMLSLWQVLIGQISIKTFYAENKMKNNIFQTYLIKKQQKNNENR